MIHCIGDSHCRFFSGSNKHTVWPQKSEDKIRHFRTYHIGPATAHNLCENKSTTMSKTKINLILKEIPLDDVILFCFGEIDCRVHIPIKIKTNPNALIDTIKRYTDVIRNLSSTRNIFVWNVIPSLLAGQKFTTIGSLKYRNKIILSFNDALKREIGDKFIGIYKNLLGPYKVPDKRYYIDNVHLSQLAMPFTLSAFRSKGLL